MNVFGPSAVSRIGKFLIKMCCPDPTLTLKTVNVAPMQLFVGGLCKFVQFFRRHRNPQENPTNLPRSFLSTVNE